MARGSIAATSSTKKWPLARVLSLEVVHGRCHGATSAAVLHPAITRAKMMMYTSMKGVQKHLSLAQAMICSSLISTPEDSAIVESTYNVYLHHKTLDVKSTSGSHHDTHCRVIADAHLRMTWDTMPRMIFLLQSTISRPPQFTILIFTRSRHTTTA
ncbi:unnamed protein product [Sphagnum balticum]